MARHSPRILFALALALAIAAPGCEILGFLGGHGTQKALYTLPKGKRVLVLVDVRPELAAPPTWGSALADRIASHLFVHKAVDRIVGQDQLMDLQRDMARFRKMPVGDVADAVDADVVIQIDVIRLSVITSTEGSVTQGGAQALVKVFDRKGNRLWPMDVAGSSVEATVDPTFATEQDKAKVYETLLDQIKLRTARMFHSYSLEDKSMTK